MPEPVVDLDALADGEPAAPAAAGPELLDAVDEQLIDRLVGRARADGLQLTGPAPLVRVVDQRQRRPRMTGLPTRLATGTAAQRLRGRLGERRVRRRRARRVGRVLPQLSPQVRNFSLELLDPLSLPYDELGELLIRRTTVSRHPTMIATFARRSTRHAGDLTSHPGGTGETSSSRVGECQADPVRR